MVVALNRQYVNWLQNVSRMYLFHMLKVTNLILLTYFSYLSINLLITVTSNHMQLQNEKTQSFLNTQTSAEHNHMQYLYIYRRL